METLELHFSKLPNFLRWILFIPASFITYLTVNFSVNIAGKVLEFFSRYPMSDRVYTHLISPGVAGYFSVIVAVAMVPSRKVFFALVVTGVWLLAYGVSIASALFIGEWGSAFPGLVSSVTGVIAYTHCKEKTEK